MNVVVAHAIDHVQPPATDAKHRTGSGLDLSISNQWRWVAGKLAVTRHLAVITLVLCVLVLHVPLAHASGDPHLVDRPTPQADSSVWYRQTSSGASQVPITPASDGLFGLDHRVAYDNHGIWNRNVQKNVMYATLATVIGGSFLLGDDTKLGDTFWRSFDAVTVSAAAAQAMKWTFQRERPSQTSDPNHWFGGIHNSSFPSGEVTVISAAVTPFIVRYGSEHPAVYALAALPLYDAIARVKTHGHWQSDVIVGALLGTAVGIWASRRQQSLLVSWLPGGFSVGYVYHF
ncbi:MAG TPA: phosphatase PAP2 family protein [Oleiagrimonas sp.]|nr:phosphatase PAP2 family protein [Oleiagrimonas sp.]